MLRAFRMRSTPSIRAGDPRLRRCGNIHKLIDLEFETSSGLAQADIVREDLFFFEDTTCDGAARGGG